MERKNGLDALLEDDVHTGFAKLVDVATDHNAQLRHVGHSVIMALEALRLEIRAHNRIDEDHTEAWKRLIRLEAEADTLGTSALQDTLAAEQMSLDDVSVDDLVQLQYERRNS